MVVDPYTHTFKFELDGVFIRGEVEFNTDGKASFKMTEWSEPLPLDTLGEFKKLMTQIKNIYTANGGVKKIIIKEKV